jgi:hypothetical protein
MGHALEIVVMYVWLAVPIVTFFRTSRFNIFVRMALMTGAAVIGLIPFGIAIVILDAIFGLRHF